MFSSKFLLQLRNELFVIIYFVFVSTLACIFTMDINSWGRTILANFVFPVPDTHINTKH